MKTAVVILNWNGKDFLEKFLPGLILSAAGTGRDGETEVIVADNASTDGSMEMMESRFPEIKTIRFDRNYGFTGGYNRALFQIDAEYFVLINSDIDVPADWLEPLEEWMDTHPECGICAPKLHAYDRREMFEYAGAAGGYIDKFGYPFCRGRILKTVEKDTGQYDEPADVFWATGACLMIRASLYRKLGGLDERFFAHMEEIDLCWRTQLAGYKVTVIPCSTVYHIGGGTLPNNSPWKLYLNYRNNLLMLSNNLAYTYALKKMKTQESTPDAAASYGISNARRTIFTRMILDGCSVAVYLATFRFSYFKAVIKAHRDFRKLKCSPEKERIAGFLSGNAELPEVTGMYNGWMIPRALLKRKINVK